MRLSTLKVAGSRYPVPCEDGRHPVSTATNIHAYGRSRTQLAPTSGGGKDGTKMGRTTPADSVHAVGVDPTGPVLKQQAPCDPPRTADRGRRSRRAYPLGPEASGWTMTTSCGPSSRTRVSNPIL